ncbi:helix-turn-helix transcriptional regulator [Anaerolineales bacterium HSG24]|nr:helix-turn-helix transcriptional regulator [Anaerolineales bacterium HSG24]
MQKFGTKLRSLRTNQGLSYRQLATMLGVSYGHLAGIEAGKHNPSAELVLKIAKFFGVSTDQLMDDELEL